MNMHVGILACTIHQVCHLYSMQYPGNKHERKHFAIGQHFDSDRYVGFYLETDCVHIYMTSMHEEKFHYCYIFL